MPSEAEIASPTIAPTVLPISTAESPDAQSSPTTAGAALESGQLVDVGGHALWIRCWGAAGPTVVFDAPGPNSSSEPMLNLAEATATFARSCVYDRAGYGESDPGPESTDLQQQAAELHTLLTNAGISEPVILAGYSWGGGIAQVYASAYPEAVNGLVLIDPITGDALAEIAETIPTVDTVDMQASADELLTIGSWPDTPLIVVTRGLVNGPGATNDTELADWQAAHAALAARTSGGKQVIATDSDHFTILSSGFEFCLDAIQNVVEAT